MNGVMESVTGELREFGGIVVPLIEAKTDDKGTIPIKIIDPGWGSSGYYSREVRSRQSTSLRGRAQMFWTSKADERTGRTATSRPRQQPTEDARGTSTGRAPDHARAKVFSAYRDAVAEMGPYIGLSHYVWGESKPGEAEGKKGDIITRIVAARSVDFVTVPGRGGAIAEAFRAARPPEPTDEQKTARDSSMVGTTSTPKLTLESLRKDHPDIYEAAVLAQDHLSQAFPAADIGVEIAESSAEFFRRLGASGYDGWVSAEYVPATTTEAGLGWLTGMG